ncbi:MAG: 2-dehydropantoate 2-reductase [Chloroflexi bacterium]|nr:2-dehydropantoate 2-reductase [Chloroflexota bacterium]
MRVVIYGAGGIGGVIGGFLARAGENVTLIGRPGQVQAITDNGLRVLTPNGNYTVRLPAVTGPNHIDFGPDSVVFLCVKSQNTEEALNDLRKVVFNVPVFCFQNGVRNEETAAQRFSLVYGAMVRFGAVYLNDGEVMARRDPPGWMAIGRYPGGVDGLVETVAAGLTKAGFVIKATRDIMPLKWGKLMINLSNAIDAITGASGEDGERIALAARDELRELLNRAGLPWASIEEVEKNQPELVPPVRSRHDTGARDSTWQSLTRQQGTIETGFLNGEVVRLAKELGCRAPVNEALLRISREMATKRELPGKYTSAQLCAMVGL